MKSVGSDTARLPHPCAVKVGFIVDDWRTRLRMAWTILRGVRTEIHVHASEIVIEREAE